MTQDKYLEMMSQLNKQPIESEIPPSFEDFPSIVQDAVQIYNSLGNLVYPEVGFIGKSYENLPLYLDIYGITDVDFLLEILNWLDNRSITENNKRIKKLHDKMKQKSSK